MRILEILRNRRESSIFDQVDYFLMTLRDYVAVSISKVMAICATMSEVAALAQLPSPHSDW
jgi:hypothetical protein